MNRQNDLNADASQSTRSGFTLIELLVVVAVITVLVGLMSQAVMQARSAARRIECRNNLKQIGLATYSFHETNRALPPARMILSRPRSTADVGRDRGMDEASWVPRLLPFLEQSALADEWDLYATYLEHPPSVRLQPLDVFLCPARRAMRTAVAEETATVLVLPCGCPGGYQVVPGGAVVDYAANHGDLTAPASGSPDDFYWGGNGTGLIISSRVANNASPATTPTPIPREEIESDWLDKVTFDDCVDGLSNTVLFGESHVPPGWELRSPYAGPAYFGRYLTNFARLGGPGVPLAKSASDPAANQYNFGSDHDGVVQFVFGDGRVAGLNKTMSTRVLGRLTNRADRRAVSL